MALNKISDQTKEKQVSDKAEVPAPKDSMENYESLIDESWESDKDLWKDVGYSKSSLKSILMPVSPKGNPLNMSTSWVNDNILPKVRTSMNKKLREMEMQFQGDNWSEFEKQALTELKAKWIPFLEKVHSIITKYPKVQEVGESEDFQELFGIEKIKKEDGEKAEEKILSFQEKAEKFLKGLESLKIADIYHNPIQADFTEEEKEGLSDSEMSHIIKASKELIESLEEEIEDLKSGGFSTRELRKSLQSIKKEIEPLSKGELSFIPKKARKSFNEYLDKLVNEEAVSLREIVDSIEEVAQDKIKAEKESDKVSKADQERLLKGVSSLKDIARDFSISNNVFRKKKGLADSKNKKDGSKRLEALGFYTKDVSDTFWKKFKNEKQKTKDLSDVFFDRNKESMSMFHDSVQESFKQREWDDKAFSIMSKKVDEALEAIESIAKDYGETGSSLLAMSNEEPDGTLKNASIAYKDLLEKKYFYENQKDLIKEAQKELDLVKEKEVELDENESKESAALKKRALFDEIKSKEKALKDAEDKATSAVAALSKSAEKAYEILDHNQSKDFSSLLNLKGMVEGNIQKEDIEDALVRWGLGKFEAKDASSAIMESRKVLKKAKNLKSYLSESNDSFLNEDQESPISKKIKKMFATSVSGDKKKTNSEKLSKYLKSVSKVLDSSKEKAKRFFDESGIKTKSDLDKMLKDLGKLDEEKVRYSSYRPEKVLMSLWDLANRSHEDVKPENLRDKNRKKSQNSDTVGFAGGEEIKPEQHLDIAPYIDSLNQLAFVSSALNGPTKEHARSYARNVKEQADKAVKSIKGIVSDAYKAPTREVSPGNVYGDRIDSVDMWSFVFSPKEFDFLKKNALLDAKALAEHQQEKASQKKKRYYKVLGDYKEYSEKTPLDKGYDASKSLEEMWSEQRKVFFEKLDKKFPGYQEFGPEAADLLEFVQSMKRYLPEFEKELDNVFSENVREFDLDNVRDGLDNHFQGFLQLVGESLGKFSADAPLTEIENILSSISSQLKPHLPKEAYVHVMRWIALGGYDITSGDKKTRNIQELVSVLTPVYKDSSQASSTARSVEDSSRNEIQRIDNAWSKVIGYQKNIESLVDKADRAMVSIFKELNGPLKELTDLWKKVGSSEALQIAFEGWDGENKENKPVQVNKKNAASDNTPEGKVIKTVNSAANSSVSYLGRLSYLLGTSAFKSFISDLSKRKTTDTKSVIPGEDVFRNSSLTWEDLHSLMEHIRAAQKHKNLDKWGSAFSSSVAKSMSEIFKKLDFPVTVSTSTAFRKSASVSTLIREKVASLVALETTPEEAYASINALLKTAASGGSTHDYYLRRKQQRELEEQESLKKKKEERKNSPFQDAANVHKYQRDLMKLVDEMDSFLDKLESTEEKAGENDPDLILSNFIKSKFPPLYSHIASTAHDIKASLHENGYRVGSEIYKYFKPVTLLSDTPLKDLSYEAEEVESADSDLSESIYEAVAEFMKDVHQGVLDSKENISDTKGELFEQTIKSLENKYDHGKVSLKDAFKILKEAISYVKEGRMEPNKLAELYSFIQEREETKELPKDLSSEEVDKDDLIRFINEVIGSVDKHLSKREEAEDIVKKLLGEDELSAEHLRKEPGEGRYESLNGSIISQALESYPELEDSDVGKKMYELLRKTSKFLPKNKRMDEAESKKEYTKLYKEAKDKGLLPAPLDSLLAVDHVWTVHNPHEDGLLNRRTVERLKESFESLKSSGIEDKLNDLSNRSRPHLEDSLSAEEVHRIYEDIRHGAKEYGIDLPPVKTDLSSPWKKYNFINEASKRMESQINKIHSSVDKLTGGKMTDPNNDERRKITFGLGEKKVWIEGIPKREFFFQDDLIRKLTYKAMDQSLKAGKKGLDAAGVKDIFDDIWKEAERSSQARFKDNVMQDNIDEYSKEINFLKRRRSDLLDALDIFDTTVKELAVDLYNINEEAKQEIEKVKDKYLKEDSEEGLDGEGMLDLLNQDEQKKFEDVLKNRRELSKKEAAGTHIREKKRNLDKRMLDGIFQLTKGEMKQEELDAIGPFMAKSDKLGHNWSSVEKKLRDTNSEATREINHIKEKIWNRLQNLEDKFVKYLGSNKTPDTVLLQRPGYEAEKDLKGSPEYKKMMSDAMSKGQKGDTELRLLRLQLLDTMEALEKKVSPMSAINPDSKVNPNAALKLGDAEEMFNRVMDFYFTYKNKFSQQIENYESLINNVEGLLKSEEALLGNEDAKQDMIDQWTHGAAVDLFNRIEQNWFRNLNQYNDALNVGFEEFLEIIKEAQNEFGESIKPSRMKMIADDIKKTAKFYTDSVKSFKEGLKAPGESLGRRFDPNAAKAFSYLKHPNMVEDVEAEKAKLDKRLENGVISPTEHKNKVEALHDFNDLEGYLKKKAELIEKAGRRVEKEFFSLIRKMKHGLDASKFRGAMVDLLKEKGIKDAEIRSKKDDTQELVVSLYNDPKYRDIQANIEEIYKEAKEGKDTLEKRYRERQKDMSQEEKAWYLEQMKTIGALLGHLEEERKSKQASSIDLVDIMLPKKASSSAPKKDYSKDKNFNKSALYSDVMQKTIANIIKSKLR
jgi:hypothetical protein